MNIREQIKLRIATKITTEAFQNWVAKTSCERPEGRILVVRVPDEATKVWMEQEYGEQVQSAILELGAPVERVEYEIQAASAARSTGGWRDDVTFQAPGSQLNPKFSFESFVVGTCNQFAHAAAKSVATTPSRSYNPLFIYGGSGMGKTHLMHAIGRSLLDHYTAMKIVYTSSERFMNEMVSCIKSEKMPLFHQH